MTYSKDTMTGLQQSSRHNQRSPTFNSATTDLKPVLKRIWNDELKSFSFQTTVRQFSKSGIRLIERLYKQI